MNEDSMNYEKAWHGEAQDLSEVHEIAQAQNPFRTLQILYKCPAYLLVVVFAHYGAKDIARWQPHHAAGEFWGGVILACHFVEVFFFGFVVLNWVVSYWNANPVTQWFMLWGTVAAARYFMAPVSGPLPAAGLESLKTMVAQLIPATIGALVFEFGAILWLVRRRDSERIHRLKQVGQLVGLISAGVVAVALLVLASAGRRG